MDEKVLDAFSHKLNLLKKVVNDILEHDEVLADWEVDVLSIKFKGHPGRFELKGEFKAQGHADLAVERGPVALNAIVCFDEDGHPYFFSGNVCPRL
ncbi:hypothetical protein [Chitinophaga sp.]|uniref:hypothetical protein n=1 Tax=Chitinophaga sp. TaxID=1869181 RepID=UPI0031E36DBF